jgi:CheY-like chemotaxis protein
MIQRTSGGLESDPAWNTPVEWAPAAVPLTLEPSLVAVLALVVDDDAETRELVRRTLVRAGGEVIAVESTDEATRVLQQVIPNVAICDIGMPLRSGYDLIRFIRSLPPERGGRTPAIALTNCVTLSDRQRALQEGFDRHLPKPIDWDQLLFAVASLAR